MHGSKFEGEGAVAKGRHGQIGFFLPPGQLLLVHIHL